MAVSLPPLPPSLPKTRPVLPPLPAVRPAGLEAIAARQSQLCWWFLLLILPVSLVASFAGPAAPFIKLAGAVITIVLDFRLGRALSVKHLWLWMVGCCIPFVGWIALYSLNARATKALQAAGFNVGFMGAKAQKGSSHG